MTQTQRVSGVKTSIRSTENGCIAVNYRGTDVVTFNEREVTLNTNGYFTATTKTRMNQASNQFGLGYHVYQRDYAWFVDLPNGERREFIDRRMTFSR